jgi:hypothetical protein
MLISYRRLASSARSLKWYFSRVLVDRMFSGWNSGNTDFKVSTKKIITEISSASF